MANATQWSALSSGTDALTTQLDSLSNGSYSAVGAEIDNTTARELYINAELTVDFGSAPSTGGYVGLYLLTALDGTNYPDGGGAVAPASNLLVGNFPLRATTDAQRVHLYGITLPPGKCKLVAYNGSGQAFPSSGSKVTIFTNSIEVA